MKEPITIYEHRRVIRMLIRRLDDLTNCAVGMHQHDWADMIITKDSPIGKAQDLLTSIPQEWRAISRREKKSTKRTS